MKALVFSKSEQLPVAMDACLKAGGFETIRLSTRTGRFAPQFIQAAITDFSPDVIMIDAECAEGDGEKLARLVQLPLIELWDELERMGGCVSEGGNIEEIPVSLLLLVAAGYVKPLQLPCIFFMDNLSVALTQELLRGGADWVWATRSILVGFEHRFGEIVEKLKDIPWRRVDHL